ncbi:MAG: BamA/TamA family outer membrane protein [Ignavibacteriaceae bacterium]
MQYDEFDWKVLHSKHFDIYYYSDISEIAKAGATYAEDAYENLKGEFNNIVLRRIPLIFYNSSNHFQQTNTIPGFIPEGVGGFFEFMKGRVVIPYDGSLPRFRHVIKHELVHVFMLNKIFRLIKDHRLTSDLMPPLWFVEGMAEFFSNEWDMQSEMVLRDAVINNHFTGIRGIYSIYGTYLMYKEGESFLHFVEKEFGRNKVMMLIENLWMDSDFEKIMEITLGKEINEIDRLWTLSLKKQYYPLMERFDPIAVKSQKLTKEGFANSPVYYRKEGDSFGKGEIYFIGNYTGYSSIYKIRESDLDNKEIDPILVLQGEKEEMLETFHLMQPSMDISKKGIIAFITKSGGEDVIHFYSIEEKKIFKSFRNEDIVTISSPSFSESGERLLFEASDRSGFSDLYLLELQTGEVKRLTNDYYKDKDPIFANDDYVIFSSDRTAGENEKKFNLLKINPETGEILYLTNLDANVESPALSPGGDKLICTADYDGVQNIWELDLDSTRGKGLTRITNFISSAFEPSYIDKERVLFSGFEDFSFSVYLLDLDERDKETSTVNSLAFQTSVTAPRWREKLYFAKPETDNPEYEKEYTLDYAAGQVTTDPIYGTRGGALFAVSDLLGDDNYFFMLFNTAEVQSDFLRSFNVALTKFYLGERTNYGVGVFHFRGRRYDIQESEEYFFERSIGAAGMLNFPLSKFDRIETGLTIANSDKQIVSNLPDRKALLWSNSISYVFDNSLWASSGPIDGKRIRLMLAYTSDVKYSNVNYFSVIADYREYIRISRRSAIALRGSFYYNHGKEARRYFMGGSWDLRGWTRWSIRGEKMWISSMELRFPLIDEIKLRLPVVDISFFGIRGALFYDMGNAWDKEYTQTLGSFGGGIRINLFNVVCFRYDIGKKIENNFRQLQGGLFYQFFFGWDF